MPTAQQQNCLAGISTRSLQERTLLSPLCLPKLRETQFSPRPRRGNELTGQIWARPLSEDQGAQTGCQELEFTSTPFPTASSSSSWGSAFLQPVSWVFCSQLLLSSKSPTWSCLKLQLCEPSAELDFQDPIQTTFILMS